MSAFPEKIVTIMSRRYEGVVDGNISMKKAFISDIYFNLVHSHITRLCTMKFYAAGKPMLPPSY